MIEIMETPPILSPQPPPLPSAKKPFAFQAAQASLFAPIICIVATIFINGGGVQLSPIAKIITGSLSTLLIILGFIFGIVGLCGVRHHGKKGLLSKAFIGTCINGILIVFMIFSFFMFKKMAERARENRQQTEQQQSP